MRHLTWNLRTAATAAAVGVACMNAAGAPPPSQAQRQTAASASTQPAAQVPAVLPDIAVTNAWIGPGDPPPELYALLGRNPWVGETITLGCEIAITGNVPANSFQVAWVVDGVNTCGEGDWTLNNPPVCAFTWPFPTGTQAALTYVPHAAGTHTFKCDADTGHQVQESHEGNNSRTITFTAVARAAELGPLIRKTLTRSPYGLKLRVP